jgi:hypothetical protein
VITNSRVTRSNPATNDGSSREGSSQEGISKGVVLEVLVFREVFLEETAQGEGPCVVVTVKSHARDGESSKGSFLGAGCSRGALPKHSSNSRGLVLRAVILVEEPQTEAPLEAVILRVISAESLPLFLLTRLVHITALFRRSPSPHPLLRLLSHVPAPPSVN